MCTRIETEDGVKWDCGVVITVREGVIEVDGKAVSLAELKRVLQWAETTEEELRFNKRVMSQEEVADVCARHEDVNPFRTIIWHRRRKTYAVQ